MLHIIFSFSAFLSYTLLAIDIVLIVYLSFRAYKDADTLDRCVMASCLFPLLRRLTATVRVCRCEVPFFGPLASSILDDE